MDHGVPPRGGRPLLVLYFLPLPEQGDDRGHEPMFAAGAFGLWWPELLAPAVHVHRRPPHQSGAGVEVHVLPGQPQHLRDPPALQEQQRHGGPEAVVPGGGQPRPGLVPVEGHPVRVGGPQRLDRPDRVPDQRAHLHRLVHHQGERLAMVPHG
jgi:hypothetical protein